MGNDAIRYLVHFGFVRWQISAMACDTTRMMILDATLGGAAKLGLFDFVMSFDGFTKFIGWL